MDQVRASPVVGYDMLEAIRIKDFQCHEKLELEFDQVTTLIGSSDVGKSAVLRALGWVLSNKPDGDEFIFDPELTPHATKRTEKADEAKVSLKVDGRTVTRVRTGTGGNAYKLDGEEFRAFNRDVPAPIAAVLKVGDLNLQGQHDSPFWFSLSAGEVSRQLNAVIDLGVIDDAMAEAARRVRQYQSTLAVSKERLEKAKAQKAELEWVVEADAAYQGAEELAQTKAATTALAGLLARVVEQAKEMARVRDVAAERGKGLVEVGKAGQAAIRAATRRDELQKLLADVRKQGAVIAKGVPDFEPLADATHAWRVVAGEKAALKALWMSTENAKTRAAMERISWQKAAKELKDKTGGRCPVCGKEMDDG